MQNKKEKSTNDLVYTSVFLLVAEEKFCPTAMANTCFDVGVVHNMALLLDKPLQGNSTSGSSR